MLLSYKKPEKTAVLYININKVCCTNDILFLPNQRTYDDNATIKLNLADIKNFKY